MSAAVAPSGRLTRTAATVCDNGGMTELLHNDTVDVLLNRRSIRAFRPEPLNPEMTATIESAAQHAASSQYLNDWSAIRVVDQRLKDDLAAIAKQPYIAQAPALYVFVLDEYRNMVIAREQGDAVDSDAFTLKNSYRFTQAQNDAVLALHAMETAAESLGLGCVILGSILNDIPRLIELFHLPKYTYPVLGLAIGKPAQEPALKPRMSGTLQFFDDRYNDDPTFIMRTIAEFNEEVHQYYDLRDPNRPVPTYDAQIAQKAVAGEVLGRGLEHAVQQGFELDR